MRTEHNGLSCHSPVADAMDYMLERQEGCHRLVLEDDDPGYSPAPTVATCIPLPCSL